MPDARGEAIVNSKQGRIEIKARMEKLTPAPQFGPEYLTYVLWAVTPGGRPKNLGEVLLNGKNSHMDVTTDLQTFGLIVTAKPYFAVTQPSDVVVMDDVLFDTGKYTLKPGGREKLAKIAGIILAGPQARSRWLHGQRRQRRVNQRLSEERANSGREYLLAQNVPPNSVTAIGFGKDRPVASNETRSGRQLNRKVELIVSGDVIGTSAGASPGY
jgi:outer membrane protein OmpA-like peptidoglycan-associated protein